MTIQESKFARFIGLDTGTGASIADGSTFTDSLGNGVQLLQEATIRAIFKSTGSNTTLAVAPQLALQGNLSSFSDGTLAIGATTSRFNVAYLRQTSVRDHAAFTGSESITTTSALQTVAAATSTLWTSPALLDNSSYWVEVWITVRDTGGANRAMYQRQACIYRQAGGGATILTGTLAPVTVEAAGLAACDADIDVTGNTFRVRVTSTAATLNWVATIRYQGVSGNT